MIEIPDLGDDFHEMWAELIELTKVSDVPWTLIGAHMVALHGWSRGRTQIRTSRDADILVNARAVSDGTERLSRKLLERRFDFDGVSIEGVGHRFRREGISVDVLGPDGLGERVNLRTIGGAHTVRVPGGTQALKRSIQVEVANRSIVGLIPLPSLLGALLVKVRAILVDDQPEAQRQDCAFLLSLIDDPDSIAAQLSSAERGWLRRHQELGDPTGSWYSTVERAEDAAIAYRRLTAS